LTEKIKRTIIKKIYKIFNFKVMIFLNKIQLTIIKHKNQGSIKIQIIFIHLKLLISLLIQMYKKIMKVLYKFKEKI
jgi:hypothetical protein